MDTIEISLRIALVLDALALIALILVQQGKGANVGAAFGSGASQTMFGSAGASSFLNTLVTWLAVAFFLITFALAWTARERAESMGNVGVPQVQEEVPASEEAPAIPDGEVPTAPAPETDQEPPADGG